jgi:protein-tyrosine phosphatase
MKNERRICFVCLGNIVRSPLAENLFLYLADEAGVVDKYEVDSAGTSAYHIGEHPDGRMRRVAAGHGYKYDGRARQFVPGDLDYYDLILAMDMENLANLESMVERPEHRSKIHLLREFDPQGGPDAVVPDPYYGGIHGFEETFQIVERSIRGLLAELEKNRMD